MVHGPHILPYRLDGVFHDRPQIDRFMHASGDDADDCLVPVYLREVVEGFPQLVLGVEEARYVERDGAVRLRAAAFCLPDMHLDRIAGAVFPEEIGRKACLGRHARAERPQVLVRAARLRNVVE